jgi:hypothetical protein
MKKIVAQLAFICLCCISTCSFSQYVITPIAPPPTFSFDDLWHFTVVRSITDDNAQFYVSLRVFDGADRLRIKSNTATVSLPPGSHYYNLSNISLLQPFTTSYHDAGILQQTINSGGNFPPGTYHLVYTLYGKAADGVFTPLAEDVSEALVETLWPPMLLSPADEEIIDTRYPILTWTPAFSSSYPGQITYTLKLVELLPGQNTYQAMAANPAYFTQNNIPVTMLPYPPSAQPLDTSRTYVWQVHADAQGTQMGSSEIWSFTYRIPNSGEKSPKKNTYFLLSTEATSEYVIINDGQLRISYTENLYDTDKKLTFNIIDQKGKVIADQSKLNHSISEGYNKIRISLCSKSSGFNLPKGQYTIKIKSQRGNIYLLNFYHNKTQTGCTED